MIFRRWNLRSRIAARTRVVGAGLSFSTKIGGREPALSEVEGASAPTCLVPGWANTASLGGIMHIAEDTQHVEVRGGLDAVVREYACLAIHIGLVEDNSTYAPFNDGVFIRHLAFDTRNILDANVLWEKQGGLLGR